MNTNERAERRAKLLRDAELYKQASRNASTRAERDDLREMSNSAVMQAALLATEND